MKVSIITINLNNKSGLDCSMKSVFSQNFIDYEYLIIDGGSTDGSVNLIKNNADKIAYWVSESDKGIYNAMNKAIRKAKGEYCYFLNSGDFLLNENVLQDTFKENPSSSFISGNLYIDKIDGEKISYIGRDWTLSIYDIFSGFLAHQAFFIKRDMFEKYGLYDENLRIVSDWKLFFIAIGLNKETVISKDVDLAIYGTDGISSKIGGKAIYREKIQALQNVLTPTSLNKLERLYYLDINGFITDFILSRTWIHVLFKIAFKTCAFLRLTKE